MGALEAERLARLLADKIDALAPADVAEIERFIDEVVRRARAGDDLTRRMTIASEPAFAAVWDNPEDAVYDDL